MAVDVEITRRRFTVDEYHRMLDARILTENDRVELVRGEIVQMAPIGSRHAGCLAALNQWFVTALRGRAILWPQNPITLPPDSEPQPDIVLVRPRADFYRSQHPGVDDVLLVVEVADTTYCYDRRIKLPLYAERGIREVWIVNLEGDALEVYRTQGRRDYQTVERLTRDAVLSSEAFPDVTFSVAAILG